jgi:hypothetical protein
LRQKSVTKVGGPLDVACQPLGNLGSRCERLNAWIPRLLGDGGRQCCVFQILVSIHPLLKLNNFKRVSGSGQCLRQQWIWIEGNGGD